MVPRHMIGQPRRAGCRRHQRVKLMCIHHAINSLRPREPVIQFQRIAIRLLRQRPFRFGLDHDVLSEERHFLLAIALVEFNNLLE